MKTTEELITYYKKYITQTQVYIAFLEEHKDKIARVGTVPNFWQDNCDFDALERPQLLIALKEFPGKWNKHPNYLDDGINYCLEGKVSDLNVRCYNGEPPPSCKIEETVEYKIVPERVERVVKRKIVCPDGQSVEAQSGPELFENSDSDKPAEGL